VSANVQFPQTPFLDDRGYISVAWRQWLLNPQFLTIAFGGVLGVSSGGTALTSGNSGGVLAFIGSDTIASSAALDIHGLVVGGGAGGVPATIGVGANGQVLLGNTSAAPAWGTVSGDGSITALGVLTVTETGGVAFTAYATATIGQLPGTATNDDAAAGKIGQYVSSTLASGSAVSLTTGIPANVTSISLTAGDWDVTGVVDFAFGATTSYTALMGGISTTANTFGAQDSRFDFETPAAVPTATTAPAWVVPVVRLSLAATTTVYLVAAANFTVSTLGTYGTIRARRMR